MLPFLQGELLPQKTASINEFKKPSLTAPLRTPQCYQFKVSPLFVPSIFSFSISPGLLHQSPLWFLQSLYTTLKPEIRFQDLFFLLVKISFYGFVSSPVVTLPCPNQFLGGLPFPRFPLNHVSLDPPEAPPPRPPPSPKVLGPFKIEEANTSQIFVDVFGSLRAVGPSPPPSSPLFFQVFVAPPR